jgi:hypothetical protein
MRELLTAFVRRVGDRMFAEIVVGPSDDALSTLELTTWMELEQEGYLKPQHSFGCQEWQLTARGWLKGLEVSDQLNSHATRSRATELARALKAHVKGRASSHGEIADERDLAPRIGLPEGWIYNALASNLLNEVFPGDDMTVRQDFRFRCFRVPATFGMDWREPL